MRATLGPHVIADSEDIVESDGYAYFPAAAVRRDWLEPSPRTDRDRACPHGVQFYDVVVEGRRHPRAAWRYEAPRPSLARLADRFGFWDAVSVG